MTTRTPSSRRRRRFDERLAEHPMAFGTALLCLIAVITYIALTSTNGLPFSGSHTANAVLPSGAPEVKPGDQVRIAGQQVGLVKGIQLTHLGLQRVTFSSSKALGRNATLMVRAFSDAGGHYLAINPGSYRSEPLASDGALAAGNITYTEDFPTVIAGFSKLSLHNGSQTIRLLGAAVTGQGARLNESFEQLGRTLKENTADTFAATQTQQLPTLVRDSGIVAEAFAGRLPDDGGRFVTSSADFFAVLADPQSELGRAISATPPAEQAIQKISPDLNTALARLRTASIALRPGLVALHQALPSLTGFLSDGRRLKIQTGLLSVAGKPALRAAAPVVHRIGPVGVLLTDSLPPLTHTFSILTPYQPDFSTGSAALYIASLYHDPVGQAAGKPAVPITLVLTCAPGSDPEPKPGAWETEKLSAPCQ